MAPGNQKQAPAVPAASASVRTGAVGVEVSVDTPLPAATNWEKSVGVLNEAEPAPSPLMQRTMSVLALLTWSLGMTYSAAPV